MKLGNSKQELLVLLVFVVFSLLLFLPIFFGKVNLNGNLLTSFYAPYENNLAFKNTGWDQLRIYFPFYKITFDSWRNFELPLWNSYAFSGHPHMADFQTAVFYPLNIFGFILPQIEFWHLLRITPMIMAGFFAFLYFRNLKLVTLASFFGAFSFGFSPFILTWGEEVVMAPHSIVWLPLILFSVDKFLEKGGKKFLALIAISTAASLLGGYMQTTIYLLIVVFAYIVFRTWGKLTSLRVMRLLGALVFGISISALQILPSAELFFNGARSQIRLTETLFKFLLPIGSLLTYLAPDFFGNPATGNFFRQGSAQYYEGIMFVGVAVLVFAAMAVFLLKKNKQVFFWGILGVVSLSLTLDLPTSRLFLMIPVPFLSTSIANRVLMIPAFCLSILAAIGMDAWLSGKLKGIFKVTKVFLGLYILLIGYLLSIKYLHLPNYFDASNASGWQTAAVSLRNLVIPIVVLFVILAVLVVGVKKPNFKKIGALLIIFISFAHIFYFSQKYFSFSKREYIFPQVPIISYLQKNQGVFRSWGFGQAFLENNFASQYSLFWPEGYDSLNNKSYGEFTAAMQGTGDVANYTFRADAGLGRDDGQLLLNSVNRRKLIDLVGVRYVIGESADFDLLRANNFEMVFDGGVGLRGKHYAVFENKQVMPRVFLASNYEGPPTVATVNKTQVQIDKERRKLIVQKLLSEGFDWRNVLILEEPSSISPQFGQGTAEIVSYKNNEVVVKTQSDQPKLLFLSDNYYPGWKVKVDGKDGKILRADYTFRAVPLLAGEHMVRFYFDSDSFKWGLAISVLSLIALAFLILRKNPLTD